MSYIPQDRVPLCSDIGRVSNYSHQQYDTVESLTKAHYKVIQKSMERSASDTSYLFNVMRN